MPGQAVTCGISRTVEKDINHAPERGALRSLSRHDRPVHVNTTH
jgi:hypothetical protein